MPALPNVQRVLLVLALLSATDGSTKALASEPSCVTGRCHADLKRAAVPHPAMESGCSVCHAEGAARAKPHPKMVLTASSEGELCGTCHPGKGEGKVVHGAVAAGMCTACHNPHGGKFPRLLRENPIGKTCTTCHEDPTRGAATVHPPVGKGTCTACHLPHASDQEHLLKAPPPALCYGCHAPKDKTPVVHGAVRQGKCLACHEPHASPNPALLRTTPRGAP